MSDVRVGAVLIAGPTASGKSALGIRLAQALDGVVINADSMQVYRDLRVITARPTSDEEAQVPHRLYGHVDAASNFSVGRYVADAVKVLQEVEGSKLPIFVGGTGLYFKALTEGLSDMPPVPEEVREQVRRESEGLETPELHRLLLEREPETARTLRPSDRLRVQRALEIFAATGRPLVSFHGAREPGPLADRPVLKLFLAPNRDELRQRIDRRFESMMEQGALEEVEALGRRNLDPMLPAMRAHGVPGLLAYLRGEIALNEAIAKGQGDTRRYAKRQFTWFRHQLPDWQWVEPEQGFEAVMARINGPSDSPLPSDRR
ncbi:tRNA (adenosine(37)-N6)-dimethylallyltransferase MiaA [Microvirga soli]|uniref:tRNA (adenosine(37)-N6)-dimethylallyltransferase MiaA n=1 Tax=Microvirga soli TaxID=1854496 RepID=UPI00191EDA51|nr:tRNA (adenosine(37)-N6)-dimethylallyltransferase MiaA [Microvirga soli]